MDAAKIPVARFETQGAWDWDGEVTVIVYRPDGEALVDVFHNTITNDARFMVAHALSGAAVDLRIKYVALGDDDTTPTSSDHALGSEKYRRAVADYSYPATASVKTTTSVPASEATGFTIKEIGWFAGPTATASADSGVLVARVLYTRAKSALEILQIDRTDTWS